MHTCTCHFSRLLSWARTQHHAQKHSLLCCLFNAQQAETLAMQHSASSTSNTTTGTHAPSCCRRTRRAIPSPCTPCRACRPASGLAVCAATTSTRKAARARHRLLDWSSPSSALPQAVGHLAPPTRACRCPGSLSTASLPVGSCPTTSPSRRVYSPSRIPPAKLPEPPVTCKHELRVLDPGWDTAFPTPINRGRRSLPRLAPPQQPPSSSLALHRRRHCCLYFSSPPPVDLPIRAAPARGELRRSFHIHSSPSPCPWI
jgi:hypothetical protein